MKIKSGVVIALLASCFTVINAENKLFLENQYGAEIICRVRNGNSARNPKQNMLINNQETPIGNGVRVFLGEVPFDAARRSEWVNGLEIRTSRYVDYLSSYTPLDNYLDQAAETLLSCCKVQMNYPICKTGICNKDAIIVIRPSNIMSQWNIDIKWEAPWR